ncbi:hypothetical protein Ami103574_00070 [Aminipila butyrica]|uniref:Uncharacterized protein n=1 Tax=Aminipila butyrica TaxID=433296 RepID=A0A858BRJ5_9FIRM|nr:hypothetical protein [Aminipila butyrica]QIB67809.1 hypothetical protein Ami103574_00070 [Aminipila butyrica]
MEKISFNAGMIELAIQGDKSRVLRFNPESTNIVEGFFLMMDKFNAKMPEFQARAEAHDRNASQLSDIESARERLSIQKDIDKFISDEIDRVFGIGASAIIFADASPSAKTENGDYVASNFLNAMLPVIRAEMSKRNCKVQSIIKDHKRKAGKK